MIIKTFNVIIYINFIILIAGSTVPNFIRMMPSSFVLIFFNCFCNHVMNYKVSSKCFVNEVTRYMPRCLSESVSVHLVVPGVIVIKMGNLSTASVTSRSFVPTKSLKDGMTLSHFEYKFKIM